LTEGKISGKEIAKSKEKKNLKKGERKGFMDGVVITFGDDFYFYWLLWLRFF